MRNPNRIQLSKEEKKKKTKKAFKALSHLWNFSSLVETWERQEIRIFQEEQKFCIKSNNGFL